MSQSTPIAHVNSRVFMACLVAFSILMTPIAALATPATEKPSPSAKVNKPLNAIVNSSVARVSEPVAAPLLPSISASMVDSFPAGFDVDLDGKAEPGDKIRYTTTITNAGPDPATGLHFSAAPDASTTVIGGSTVIGPLALNESYQSVGNMTLTSANIAADCATNSLRSVTCNDTLSGGSLTHFGDTLVTAGGTVVNGTNTVITTNGGTVLLNTDGTFVYDPAAGFEGADSFFYTLTNSTITPNLTETAQVTINVGGVNGMVWFVTSAGGGTGRQANPFTLAAFNTANSAVPTITTPADNDTVFLFEGTHVGPVTLRTGQKFIGQDATVSVTTLGGPALPSNGGSTTGNAYPGINPTGTTVSITSATTGITLNSGNNLAGFTASGSTVAITGGAVGSLSVREVTINSAGAGLIIATSGTLVNSATFTGFPSISSAGGTNGISLTGVAGTLSSGGTGGTLAGSTGATFNVFGGTVSATYTGNVTQANNTAMVFIGGGHVTGTITFQTGTLSATNGTGLQFDNADGSYNFNGTNTLSGGDAGIDILNGSAGTFNFGTGTAITHNLAGTAFNLNGSNANVTYSGSITDNLGRAVDIDNHDAGTVTFQTGSINASGASATGIRVANSNGGTVNFNSQTTLSTQGNGAVSLTSNTGAAINFNAAGTGLDITTAAGAGFLATGGGTVTVQGAGNTITSGTGTALTISSTTIGPSDVTFQSISANGAFNGIILSNTGTDGLIVAGTGAAGSGGLIQNTIGSGVDLTNANAVSLTNLNINTTGTGAVAPGVSVAPDGHGIEMNGGSGLTLTGVQVINAGNADNEHGLAIVNATGTVTLSGTTFNGAANDLVYVTTTGALNFNVISSSSFLFPAGVGGAANSAILLEPSGSGAITASVQNSTFTNIVSASAQIGANTLGANGTQNFTFSNNTINVTLAARASGVTVSGQELTTTNITIDNNNFSGAGGNGVISIDTNDTSIVKGTVNGNIITSPPGIGIFVAVDEAAKSDVTLNGNTITNSGGDGIQTVNFGGVGVSTMDMTITNNQVNGHSLNTAVSFLGGIAFSGFEDSTCLVLRGNIVTGTPVSPTQCGGVPCVDYYLEELGGTTTLEEVPNTAATIADAAYVNSINDPGPVTIFGVIDLTNGISCNVTGLGFNQSMPRSPNGIKHAVASLTTGTPQRQIASNRGPHSKTFDAAETAQQATAFRSHHAPRKFRAREDSNSVKNADANLEQTRFAHARKPKKSSNSITRMKTAAGEAASILGSIGAVEIDLPDLPAGESIQVVFDVTVDSRRVSYSAQGTVTADGIIPVLTDDPDIGGATDPTVTPGDCQVSFSVTSVAGAGAGTLREGISLLCDGGTIDFNIAGAGPHTITLSTGQLLIDKDLTITNTSGESVTINGGGNDRIFSISASRTVSIRNLTVTGGAPTDAAGGGGILNNGTLSLINMSVSGNGSGNAIGGGISNNGVLNVINSTISGNNSGVGGGGLSGFGTSTTTVINTTISGNTSDVDGGGVYALDTSAITLINCTITNNRADNDNNASGTGGGIFRLGGTVTLRNTIVAGNFNEDGASDAADDIGGTVDAASSFNLIGTGGSGGLTDGVNNNQVGVADARLGALTNNGGTTLTHALLSGSVALDTGSNGLLPADTFDLDGDLNTAEPLPVDQRGPGFPRVQDAADLDTTQTVDIGAFEASASVEDITDKSTPEDTVLSFSFNVGDASAIATVTATSSNTTLVPNLPANLSVSGAGSSRTLNITPALNENSPASGTATITVTVTSGTESMIDTFILTVTEVNDAPTAGADLLTSVAEDSGVRSISIASLLVNDNTGPANESSQTLMLTAVSSPVGGTVVINGANVEFTPAADFNGAAGFQYTVTDDGTTNAVADPRTANGVVSFTITEVNDAPTAVDDILANIGEDSGVRIIPFTDLTANDSPGPANESGQTLTVTNVSNPVGGTVLINGTNVEFTPTANFSGAASFDYTIVDNGTTNGVADPLPGAAAATASFAVDTVADTPSVTNATTSINTQTTSGLVISRNPADGAEVTHFKITNIVNGTLFQNDGTTPINANDFITFAQGNAGLKFTPGAGLTSPGSSFTFDVQASISNINGGLGGGIATAMITVNPSLTITVNTLGDAADLVLDGACDTDAGTAGDQCTLRAAIQETNNAASDDIINFSLPPASTIALLSALDVISGNLVINGPGANMLTVRRDGAAPNFRIFRTSPGTLVTISGLTISNGNDVHGGGIYNDHANLRVEAVTSEQNSAPGASGGAIYNDGQTSGSATLTILNSTFSGNSAAGGTGGAIYNNGIDGSALVTVVNSTFSGNAAANGGAIANEGSAGGSATLRVFNSTFSGNNATVSGGGILNLGTTGNTVLEIVNTILNHGTGANIVNTGTGTVTSQGHNLSSDAAGGDGATGPGGLLNQTGDQRNTNPRLGPLANNGGPTLTHALLAGSPALDAGDNAFVTDPPFSGPGFTDQRGAGFGRILDAADAGTVQTVDIGAFEADPSVEDIADKSTNEDTALPTFTFNVGDAATAFDSITAVSSNTTLVPNGNITVGPDTPSTRTLSITPAANESGAVTITVTVTKTVAGTVVSMSDTFVLTVTGDNDNPTTTGIPDLTVNEDAVNTMITLTSFFNDVEDGSAGLIYTVQANTNPGLFTSTGISSGVLTLDYAPNAFGSADITIRATDSGGLFVDDTFTVTINGVNDAPTLDALSNLTIDEDAAAQMVNLAGITDGASEGQTLSVTAVSNNTSLIPNPTVTYTSPNTTGSLSFTPVADQNGGPVTITVTVMDNGGTTNGGINSFQRTFTVTVNAVNDAPTFQIVSSPPAINEDDPAQTLNSFASNFQPGPPAATDETGQTLVGYTVTLTGTTGDLAFTSGPSIDNAGTLTYTPSANTSGTATFNAVATDSGSGTPPNVNQSAAVAFTITVNAVNDPPVNSVPGAQSVIENSPLTFSTANANAISISDIDAGANPVQVTLTAANGLMSLGVIAGLSFTVGDGVNDATMTFTGAISDINAAMNGLVFTPTPGFDGAASIQIVTNDQGNTGSGGALSDTDTVNINVLDGGTLAFSSATYTIGESGPVATITVNRSGGSNGEARIDYATTDGTATGGGTDYTFATGLLVFADGVTTQTFTVPINNDTIDEPDETVNLTLSNPQGSGALGAPATAVLTITDDDPLPSISIDDPSVTEGNSGTANLVFTVTLSNPSSQTVTVSYATGNNTAEAPGDFVAIPATLLTFNPLETSKQITVLVNGDTDFEPNETLELNLSSPSNATLADAQGLGLIVDDDAQGGTFVFSSADYFINEDAGSITITVNRLGTATEAVTVDYATSDITASERSDYTTAVGTLNFPVGATSATFKVLVNIDSYAEGSELVGLTLSNPSFGAALGIPSNATLQIDNIPNAEPNTIDDAAAFVDQHYHDFLNRVPDAAGRAFWIDQITSCGSDATCIEIKRINVSAAFFLSIEFQETGFTAFLTNTATFGAALPDYRSIERDTQALQRGFVFTAPGSADVLEANKVAFFNAFVERPEFIAIYGSLTNEQYVDGLIANTGVVFNGSERDALVAGLNSTTETRATVLRKITENTSFQQAQFNRAFVYTQYVGYLRRNPADPPDNNLDGFNFWLNKLDQFNGNFIEAEMVKAFITSTEYRQRFGP